MKFALVSRPLVVSALLALLVAGSVAGAAGRDRKVTCKGGKVPVTVAKKTTCRPLAKALPKPKAIDLRLADLEQALKFDPARALHGKKRKRGARTLQSGFGAAGKRAQKKLLKVLPKALAFIDRKGGGARLARLPAAAPALASSGCAIGPAGPIGQTGGATMGTLGDNGGYIDAPAGGGLRVRLTFVSCGGVGHFHIADCPTANGSVDATGSGEFRATIEIWDRGQLVSRNSSTFEEKAKTHGEVGADAKLKFIDVEHTQELFIVASGGIVVRGGVTRKVRIEMPGGGYDAAGAGVRFFGDPVSGDTGADSFASTAKAAIASYRGAEPRWSTFNPPGGYCAEPAFSPESNTLKLKRGDKKQLGIYAKAKDGGRASAARWTLSGPENADFSPSTSQDAAPNISYTVMNAAKGNQIKVIVKFTSTAGVGEKTWTQPIEGGIQHISGTFSGHWEGPSYEGGPNYHYQYTGIASFDRRPTGTYPAVFDLVSGTISESYTGVTAPDDYHQPSCKVAAHAERVFKPSPDNYFELAGAGSSHSDPPFAHLIYLIDSTGEGEVTYSECEYDFDEGTDGWGGNYFGEVFTGYGPDEFAFTGSLGAPEGEGEQTWSFTGTP
jgi:hypothetical protein